MQPAGSAGQRDLDFALGAAVEPQLHEAAVRRAQQGDILDNIGEHALAVGGLGLRGMPEAGEVLREALDALPGFHGVQRAVCLCQESVLATGLIGAMQAVVPGTLQERGDGAVERVERIVAPGSEIGLAFELAQTLLAGRGGSGGAAAYLVLHRQGNRDPLLAHRLDNLARDGRVDGLGADGLPGLCDTREALVVAPVAGMGGGLGPVSGLGVDNDSWRAEIQEGRQGLAGCSKGASQGPVQCRHERTGRSGQREHPRLAKQFP